MAYGFGTRSHMRSTEYRQMKQERHEATAKYEVAAAAGRSAVVEVGPFCTCAQRQHPHRPHGRETALQVAGAYRAQARRKA